MEWIKGILDKHVKEDGTLDKDAAMEDIKQEFPNNAVPKNVYNDKAEDLKTANKLVEDLKKNNKDAEDLQTKIEEYEKQVKQLEAERAEERKTYALKEALTKEGASDIDYMLYKLGEVEVDKEGNIVDLDNKVKALKESNPTFFASDDANKGDNNPPGYRVVDNGLNQGKPSDPAATATAEFEKALGLTTD